MATDLLIPAKTAAEILGLARLTRTGRPSNHPSFLARMEQRYGEAFPRPRWNGNRRYYEQSEILHFKDSLPTTKKASVT